MKNFAYFRPTTAEQAVSLLEARWGNTEMLAGGTGLVGCLRDRIQGVMLDGRFVPDRAGLAG